MLWSLKMKRYRYGIIDENDQFKEIILSEDDILRDYWEFWSRKMAEKYGQDHEDITPENCVDDWVTTRWAIEVKES